MKHIDKKNSESSAFLFNVDILVEDKKNAVALEKLIHLLNQCGFKDYRIKSGSNLGRLIQELEQRAAAGHGAVVSELPPMASFTDKIRVLITENRLIRLKVNKKGGGKISIPCRLLNFDEDKQTLTVYHVDEKQVYTYKWNEIDDFEG